MALTTNARALSPSSVEATLLRWAACHPVIPEADERCSELTAVSTSASAMTGQADPGGTLVDFGLKSGLCAPRRIPTALSTSGSFASANTIPDNNRFEALLMSPDVRIVVTTLWAIASGERPSGAVRARLL